MKRSLGAKQWGAAIGLWLLIATFYLAHSELVRVHFPLDDAWIHQVYARSFATGDWFAFNPGQQEVGATSPLWAIVTAPTHWFEGLGIDAVVFAIKLIGLGCVAVCLASTQRALSTITSGKIAGGAVALFALEPRLMFSALSGMETTLLLALITGALYTYMRGPLWLSGLLIALTPTCRPEAVLLLGAWGIAVFALPQERRPRGRQWLALPLVAIPTLLWALFCHGVTGHWLPNTFYAKAHSPPVGRALSHLFEILTQRGFGATLAFWVGLIAFVVACTARPRRDRLALLAGLVVLPLMYALGVSLSREVEIAGYYWTRWLDPATLLLTAASCAGLAIALAAGIQRIRARSWTTNRDRAAIGGGVAAMLALALALPTLARDVVELRLKLATDANVIEVNNESVGKWLAENTAPGDVIGIQDSGAIHYFSGRKSIDILGLNDQDMMFRRKSLDEFVRQIDWFVGYEQLVRTTRLPVEPVVSFSVPYELYTICPCPTQTEMIVYQKQKR